MTDAADEVSAMFDDLKRKTDAYNALVDAHKAVRRAFGGPLTPPDHGHDSDKPGTPPGIPNQTPPPSGSPPGTKTIGGYTCGWLGGRAGWRGALTMPWGDDPAKPVWNCFHQHATAAEAVSCAEDEAMDRTCRPVTVDDCFDALTESLERNKK